MARRRPGRAADLALAVAVLATLAVVAARGPFGDMAEEELSGIMRVADGDSLVHGAARIRLRGIDAPEIGQRCRRPGGDYACGAEARTALARLVEGRAVSCRGARHDRYGRLLADCTAGGVALNRAMVEAGWAIAYGGYDREEAAARQARRGLWVGSLERPQDWRRAHDGLAEERHDRLSAFFDWLRGLSGG